MRMTVAVRALCEFSARQGDLDLRFTPAPSAQEGMAGHSAVAERRGDGYESEVSLSGEHDELTVRGRADGFDAGALRLEEIKTYRGDLDAMGENQRALHWAQARVYGHLMCQSRKLDGLNLALVYVDVESLSETVLSEWHDAQALADAFAALCQRYIVWAERQALHRRARDASLSEQAFPHGDFRPGQRELAVAVYRAARDRKVLLAQAPTGIGKTLGTLYPALKACASQGLDKVFFLAAKGSGRGLALKALGQLKQGEGGLRVVELLAREKACLNPDKHCNGDSCSLARGFYDRLPAARAALEAEGDYSQAALSRSAAEHQLCPYFLNQEMARWADVVVGDYNYYYDANGLLYMLTQAYQWRVAVLVDEAHNLVERARAMYSASLSLGALAAARRVAPKSLRKPLDGLKRSWSALTRKQEEEYAVHDSVPAGVLAALQKLVLAVAEYQAGGAALPPDDPLLQFYFDALRFERLAEQFGDHSLADSRTGDGDAELGLRNVVPAPFLAPRYAGAHTTVLFSGTLNPAGFYRDTLGLPQDARWTDVPAPFKAEQLQVHVAGHISTRFRDRERSVAPIGGIIAGQYSKQPGNYLAFLSSFDYARQVSEWLAVNHPALPVWTQTPGMGEGERDAFLARFTEGGQGVGFAVLGGAFSEGVDLPGNRLVGAFIATLGLPQLNPVNEAMMRAMQRRFGEDCGYDYIYLYPGLRKVVQAAGRVIRGESDRGSVHLIDDRYRWSKVRRLLPQWWELA